jgi:hypothetical protein
VLQERFLKLTVGWMEKSKQGNGAENFSKFRQLLEVRKFESPKILVAKVVVRDEFKTSPVLPVIAST